VGCDLNFFLPFIPRVPWSIISAHTPTITSWLQLQLYFNLLPTEPRTSWLSSISNCNKHWSLLAWHAFLPLLVLNKLAILLIYPSTSFNLPLASEKADSSSAGGYWLSPRLSFMTFPFPLQLTELGITMWNSTGQWDKREVYREAFGKSFLIFQEKTQLMHNGVLGIKTAITLLVED
jgi:hypothetical protein